MTVSLEDQIACVRRELAMRKNVYAKWVKAGRMKQEVADKEIAAMQAIHDGLTAAAERSTIWHDANTYANRSTDLMLGFYPPNRYGLVRQEPGRWRWLNEQDEDALALGLALVMPIPGPPGVA